MLEAYLTSILAPIAVKILFFAVESPSPRERI
jgi:hypothetical protein